MYLFSRYYALYYIMNYEEIEEKKHDLKKKNIFLNIKQKKKHVTLYHHQNETFVFISIKYYRSKNRLNLLSLLCYLYNILWIVSANK